MIETSMKSIGYSLASLDLVAVLNAIDTKTPEETLLMLEILKCMELKSDYRKATDYSVNQTDTNYDEKNS